MRGIVRCLEERGETVEPGDVILHNSAYHGASHGPDVGVCVPAVVDGAIVGYAFTTAHHLDIGALHPGSCGIVDAVDAYAEGLQLKAIKVVEEGRPNRAVWQILRDNVRASEMVVGDLEAQVAACKIGAERFAELVEREGLARVEAAGEALMDYSERMLRRRIAALPDGTYTAEGRIDGFLDADDPAYRDLPIRVAVTIAGSDMHVDLTGTAPQVDRPINMPFEGTVDIAIALTVRSILLDSATTEHVPQNEGLTRPITITAPKGCLANPTFPAPTIARFCAGNILSATVMRALAAVVPSNVAAGIGNLKVTSYSGLDGERYWVLMDITEGAYGGRDGLDGMDAVDTLFANTRNNPVEDIESHYPLRIRRYELREDAQGAGRFRGGIGPVRDVEFLADARFSVEGDGSLHRPWGLFGGEAGTTGGLLLNPGTEHEQALPSNLPDRRTRKGDVLRLLAPCGGGYGDPFERDPAAVGRDVEDGLVTPADARERYGVALVEGQVDAAATAALRAAPRAAP